MKTVPFWMALISTDFRFSVSTEPGQSRVFTCTNAKSVDRTLMMLYAPKEDGGARAGVS